MFDKTANRSGCIFLDKENDPLFTDRHSIIYGHNMKDGTMFSKLEEYKNQSFYDTHPNFWLLLPNRSIEVKIFSGYVVPEQDDTWKMTFETDGEFNSWLENIKKRSCFDSESMPDSLDKVITLSTCSYEYDDARFVLMGWIAS